MSEAATLGDILISVYENTYTRKSKSVLICNTVSGYDDMIKVTNDF